MSNRSAIDTIKGYFYQFDYAIEQILNLSSETDEVTVEGIEDVDIETSSERTAIQCKYYAKTEYNHSVIAQAIRYMLDHFKKMKTGKVSKVKYYLYGHYSSGQDKLIFPIDVAFLKQKFLTYTHDKKKHEYHIELGMSDIDLQEFLNLLSINVKAKEYQTQFQDIITALSTYFSCDPFEAEYYFYNNALNEIRKIAINGDVKARKISKKDFLNRINHKEALFNKWFVELKGQQSYHKQLKRQYFTTLNKSPFERFFIIELPATFALNELKDIIQIISSRYSKLSQREPKPFCPYICFSNINDSDLIKLKKQLYIEGFIFIDGIPFLGADFYTEVIKTEANFHNQIKAKILKDTSEVTNSLKEIPKTKEVYQFYLSRPHLTISDAGVKNILIPIEDINHIKEII